MVRFPVLVLDSVMIDILEVIYEAIKDHLPSHKYTGDAIYFGRYSYDTPPCHHRFVLDGSNLLKQSDDPTCPGTKFDTVAWYDLNDPDSINKIISTALQSLY